MRDDELLAAVARRVVPDGRLLKLQSLAGGVSASMHALEVRDPRGELRRLVVRRHGAAGWKPLPQGVTASEFSLLEALSRQGMAVPQPLLLDESCEVLPTPYLVMEFVEGTSEVDDTELPRALSQMADFLAGLHSLQIEGAKLPTLPDLEDPLAGILEYLPADAFGKQMHAALTGADPPSGAAAGATKRRSLLHGDYWPGNMLWQHGLLVAVVDWEDAAFGDPLSDLACCRVELLCRYDDAAMESFTAHYLELSEVDSNDLPLWELYVSSAALATMANWGLEPEAEADRRQRTRGFMERAGSQLLRDLQSPSPGNEASRLQ